jgi:hypothetical protein
MTLQSETDVYVALHHVDLTRRRKVSEITTLSPEHENTMKANVDLSHLEPMDRHSTTTPAEA